MTRLARMSMLLPMLLMATVMAAAGAQAQTRAWLDRDSVALGESATLNIETDQALSAAPDYSALLRDFEISGNTSSRQVQMGSNGVTSRELFAVALRPRRDGVLPIPALRIGNAMTQPLALTVTAASAAPTGIAGDAATFIESETDTQSPYVQQAVSHVVRLYSSTAVISGRLDQPTPDGASLQQVGQDVQSSREINGRRYTVVERRFVLIAERSGTLTIPGATFEGRGAGNVWDDVFNDGQREIRANGPPRFLQVRAAPANAPQPWLPLRALSLRYLAAPQSARVGEAATVTIEATADGATAAQMPEITLQLGDGAQVFAEPAQVDESLANGRPQVRATRRFSIVPARAGTLRVAGPRLPWWDVRASVARVASLPDLSLDVAPGADVGPAAGPASGAADVDPAAGDVPRDRAGGLPGSGFHANPWVLAAVGFAVLWLLTLLWAMRGRSTGDAVVRPVRRRRDFDAIDGGLATDGMAAPEADSARSTVARSSPASAANLRALRQLLDAGDLADIGDMLCAMATPPVADVDQLPPRLDDAGQVAAIGALQRARWRDGDPAAARAALRQAFKGGPKWRAHTQSNAGSPLPPLYPEGGKSR